MPKNHTLFSFNNLRDDPSVDDLIIENHRIDLYYQQREQELQEIESILDDMDMFKDNPIRSYYIEFHGKTLLDDTWDLHSDLSANLKYEERDIQEDELMEREIEFHTQGILRLHLEDQELNYINNKLASIAPNEILSEPDNEILDETQHFDLEQELFLYGVYPRN